MIFVPNIEGNLQYQASTPRFIASFCNRVDNGFLTGRPGSRSNYKIVESNPANLRMRAKDWWTAINVGMNDLDLRFSTNSVLHYRIVYWRRAAYGLCLCGLLGVIGVIFFLWLDLPSYIRDNAHARLPGLSVNQTLWFAWVNLSFWGFVWPWILIGLHKRALRRLLTRIVREVDQQAVGEASNA